MEADAPMTTITLPSLSDEDTGRVAAWIVGELTARAEPGAVRTRAATWLPVAAALRCRVHPFNVPGARRGEYCPAEDGAGVITVNMAYGDEQAARVLVHESAHALMRWHVAFECYDCADAVCCCYDDEPGDVRHQIARRVERLVIG